MRELHRLPSTNDRRSYASRRGHLPVFAPGSGTLRLPEIVRAYLELDRRTIASLSTRRLVVVR
jgi:hypothetical protein